MYIQANRVNTNNNKNKIVWTNNHNKSIQARYNSKKYYSNIIKKNPNTIQRVANEFIYLLFIQLIYYWDIY